MNSFPSTMVYPLGFSPGAKTTHPNLGGSPVFTASSRSMCCGHEASEYTTTGGGETPMTLVGLGCILGITSFGFGTLFALFVRSSGLLNIGLLVLMITSIAAGALVSQRPQLQHRLPLHASRRCPMKSSAWSSSITLCSCRPSVLNLGCRVLCARHGETV